MNETVQVLIDMLKGREESMKDYIKLAEGEDKIFYVGWLRGIESSRNAVEVMLRKDKE